MTVFEQVAAFGARAKAACPALATSSEEQRDGALAQAAALLRARVPQIIAANELDMAAGREKCLSAAMLDRLLLTPERIEKIATAVEEIIALDDPLGLLLEERTRPNGLLIQKVSVPLGVIGIIFESRPNVTVDAATLCLKAGNATLLRGGSEAIHSNLALAAVLQDALEAAGLPRSGVEMLDFTDREAVAAMAGLDQYLSLIIPRGGHALIRAVVENATVPVIKHDRGMTQIYVDATCDLPQTVALVHNSKVQRPGVCNAVENLFLHQDNLAALQAIGADLQAAGVEIRGCPRTCAALAGCVPATDEDFDTEYLDLILAVKVVDSLEEALTEIAAHSSGLTEAIYTNNAANAERFLRAVDSACVYHNASTRFTDGGEFGLGAEIGISTDKMHARGPMGVRELTSYKYLVRGEGQVRA
ncbi:MAG TPA: glutamate-5-semialdehyde dehydrogenase [Armatimonadota bacterium]|jgi:glutamate-5-semialdehyde dehydrogenase